MYKYYFSNNSYSFLGEYDQRPFLVSDDFELIKLSLDIKVTNFENFVSKNESVEHNILTIPTNKQIVLYSFKTIFDEDTNTSSTTAIYSFEKSMLKEDIVKVIQNIMYKKDSKFLPDTITFETNLEPFTKEEINEEFLKNSYLFGFKVNEYGKIIYDSELEMTLHEKRNDEISDPFIDCGEDLNPIDIKKKTKKINNHDTELNKSISDICDDDIDDIIPF